VQSIQTKFLNKTIIWIIWVLINYVTCVAWWRVDRVISLSYLSSDVLDVYKTRPCDHWD
jgi:TM2 domain-containing membrane protein YozV